MYRSTLDFFNGEEKIDTNPVAKSIKIHEMDKNFGEKDLSIEADKNNDDDYKPISKIDK
jgi:hypothetical protein